jgi:UDP-glucose 4-epimerase
MKILATGGAGYIGSHTVVELLAAGHDVVIVDNLANSKLAAVDRIAELGGRAPLFCQVDLRDREAVHGVFAEHQIETVVHFAGLKAVGESIEQPLEYYESNIRGTLNLCAAMKVHDVRKMVFSSSCTVYGTPEKLPLDETHPTGGTTNPYARSKLMIEEILRDLTVADSSLDIALLRYFNPVGSHVSGRIGEDPFGVPNNLVPYVAQVAVGARPFLRVFGDDYPTRDGTCIRDYVHVVDLAVGHLRAIERLEQNPGLVTYNLGTGRGYTVLEMLAAFSAACGRDLPRETVGRRAGDLTEVYADPSKALRELGWSAERGIDEMCADSWRWQSANPNGYP